MQRFHFSNWLGEIFNTSALVERAVKTVLAPQRRGGPEGLTRLGALLARLRTGGPESLVRLSPLFCELHSSAAVLHHRHLLLQGLEDGTESVDERLDFCQWHGALVCLLHDFGREVGQLLKTNGGKLPLELV